MGIEEIYSLTRLTSMNCKALVRGCAPTETTKNAEPIHGLGVLILLSTSNERHRGSRSRAPHRLKSHGKLFP